MINSGRVIPYPAIGMAINLTHYETAGEFITRNLSGAPVTSATYVRRHLILTGSFDSAFPELAPEADRVVVGDVWPPLKERNTKTFTVTALENGSEYLCVIPRSGGQIKSEQLNVVSGGNLNVAQGCILVPMGPCQIGGVERATKDVVVLLNNGATITTAQDVKVWQFWNNKFNLG
jgi:hypothetical protein